MQIVADWSDACHRRGRVESGVAVIGEHFDNAGGLKPAFFISLALGSRYRLVQHHAGYGQCLGAFVIEQRVHVCHQLADPGIELEPLAESGDQASGNALALARFEQIAQAQRTNPEVCGASYRIGGFQRMIFVGRCVLLYVGSLHPRNVGKNSR